MTEQSWSGDERAFFDALRALVSERFSKIPQNRVQAVLSAFSQELKEKASGADKPEVGGWTGRISSDVIHPFLPSSEPARPSAPSVVITADSPALVGGVLYQVLQVGAVLVHLDPAPALNDLVAVCLEFPEAHLKVETTGRVVHKSERGTAIEVSGLTQEDRLALQAISEDIAAQEAAQSAGPMTRLGEQVSKTIMSAGPKIGGGPESTQSSFAPFGGRRGARRMVSTTMRRKVDLPDPDIDVGEWTRQLKSRGGMTRELYGPAPRWFEPLAEADRIEELAADRVLDILLQLSANGFTGVLIYEGARAPKEQYVFDSGYLVERATQTRVPEDELGPMLQGADRISKRQLAMAAAHADELELTVERSLMELDILSPEELRHAIAGRLTFLLRELCEQREGEVRIYDSQALPAGFLPQPPLRVHVAVERVIYDRFYQRLSQLTTAEREERMAGELDASPAVIAEEQDRLERAVTQADQQRLLERVITGRKRLREVLTESALSPSETFAVVYSLHRMGLMRFDHSLHATVVRERIRENITVKYLSVHKASYFEVLNVHWSSYSEVVEKAYQELKAQFAPEAMPEDLEEEVHQRASEIRERIEAAYAALARRKTRHGYRRRIMPEYKLAHAIPLFLKQSELAERRGQWEEARDAVRRVLEIDPEHEEGQRRLLRIEEIINGWRAPDPKDSIL